MGSHLGFWVALPAQGCPPHATLLEVKMGLVNLPENYLDNFFFNERIFFELRKLRTDYQGSWDLFSNAKNNNKLRLGNEILHRFGMLHNPSLPTPKNRMYSLVVTQQLIDEKTSAFIRQTPVRIGNQFNGVSIPYELIEEELNEVLKRFNVSDKKEQERIKEELAKKFCSPGGEGQWIPLAINIWDNKKHVLHFVERIYDVFNEIYSRQHHQSKTTRRVNLGIYFWKLKEWKKLKEKQIVPIYSYISRDDKILENLIDYDDKVIGKDEPDDIVEPEEKEKYIQETISLVKDLIRQPNFPVTLPV